MDLVHISDGIKFAMTISGLSMNLLDSNRGNHYFAFEHNPQYQKVQFEFLDAVETLEPQAIMVGVIL